MPGEGKNAFTLAEVLITIAIIGVVAAMTIPNLVQDYKDRQHKIQSTNFQRKFGEVIKVMDSQSVLQGWTSTEEFVGELQKHMKVVRVCSTTPTDCFPKSVKLADGTVYDTTKVKTSADLGRESYNTNVVGVQFGDGVNALIAYNPNYFNLETDKTVKFSQSKVGKLNLVNMTTSAVSVVFDTSGYEKPNQVGIDITGVNAMLGDAATSTECVDVGTYCVTNLGTGYDPIPCIAGTGVHSEYCGKYSDYTNDYWAGGNKTCAELGMRQPTLAEIKQIYAYSSTEENPGLSGTYFTSDEIPENNTSAYILGFGTSPSYGTWKNVNIDVMCIQ